MILRHRLHCTVVRDSGEGQQENGDRLTEAEAGKEGGHCQQWIDGHSAQGKVRVVVGCVCVCVWWWGVSVCVCDCACVRVCVSVCVCGVSRNFKAHFQQ